MSSLPSYRTTNHDSVQPDTDWICQLNLQKLYSLTVWIKRPLALPCQRKQKMSSNILLKTYTKVALSFVLFSIDL